MIPAEYYQYIYLAIITIMTMIYVARYTRTLWGNSESGALIYTIFMILFIGFRPISHYFGDMPGYAYSMDDNRFADIPVTWDNNYIFYPMMTFLATIGASRQTPIIILAAINFISTFIAFNKIFPKNVFLAMLVFFGAFSTFGAATNGLKAGCAAALFLVALAYREKRLISILFLILSLGFHHSMQLPIAAYLVCYFYKNTRVFLYFWGMCLIIAIAHITSIMALFASYTDETGSNYLLTEAGSLYSEFNGHLGFRYDFVIYSVIPIVLGYYAIFKKKLVSNEYQFMLNVYILTNAIWMLCMYANYTNRIAYLSWLMYPVLILYPFMNMEWGINANKHLTYAVYGHLGFTLFMTLIYYVL
jgi:hypothetical protein